MAKLTKKQFEDVFREEVLPYVAERYERDGIPDKPARREAWNDAVDAYMRDRRLPENAGNWGHPRWLETYRPRASSRHATKKPPGKKGQLEVMGGYTVDLDRGGRLVRERIDLTTPGDYGADPLGDGTFRMVPSGDIVDFAERTRRLDERARRTGSRHATKKSAGTYTVHGHMQRRDGRQEAFWTRTGLSKSAADKLAREQRRESGGVARVVAEDRRANHATKRSSSEAWSAGGGRHHASAKTPAQLDREIAQVVGPSAATWKKSDQPFNSEHLDVGNASARVKPTSTYSGADYEWTIWIGPSGRRVLHQSGETRTKAAAKRAAERKLAALRQ